MPLDIHYYRHIAFIIVATTSCSFIFILLSHITLAEVATILPASHYAYQIYIITLIDVFAAHSIIDISLLLYY
jgi:hypothetical protein